MRRTAQYRLLLLLPALLWGCGYDDFGGLDDTATGDIEANVDIGELKALYGGRPVQVTDDMVIAGYVTANDKSGNFYRTFVIDDRTGAVEISAGLYDLHNLYPLGRYVAVRAEGLWVGEYNGVLQIGLKPVEGSGRQTGYFDFPAVIAGYVYPGVGYAQVTPIPRPAAMLTEQMCGQLVSVSGLSLDDYTRPESPELSWSDNEEGVRRTGYRVFTDMFDTKIAVATSGYARFASETVPRGRVTITGILSYGQAGTAGRMFILKFRDTDDVVLE